MFEFFPIKEITGDSVSLALINTLPTSGGSSYLPCYWFDIVSVRGDKVGRCDLRIGQNANSYYIGNIGYSVYREHRGHRYAAEACLLLFPLAKKHGMEDLFITTLPGNQPSRRTCELVGGELVEIVDVPPSSEAYREDRQQVARYRVDLAPVEVKSLVYSYRKI